MRMSLLTCLLLLPALAAADGLPTSPYVQVTGRGELQVTPDMLRLSLTLEKTGLDVTAARADVEARAAKVIALARKLGIGDKDIDAPAVTVYPEYRWGSSDDADHGPKLVGQHVTRAMVLTLRDPSRYGALVDGLFAAGVTRLDGVTPDRSDRALLQQKALALAVQDAHDKAAGLAKSAGVNLGAVYSIAEQGGGPGPRPMMMAMAARAPSAPAEYLPGEIEIDADVQIYYLLNE